MANRVFGELAKWTTLDDAALDKAISAISNGGRTPNVRAQARRLFATALETPGGLKVQTIHAFCTRLLQQFPFEANVAARFTVLDEAAEAQLLNRTSMDVLLEAAQKPDGALGRALAVAISAAADQTFKDVVREAIRKRDVVTAWIDARRQRRRGDRRTVRRARRRSATTRSSRSKRRFVDGPHLPPSRMAGADRDSAEPARRPTRSRRPPAAALRRRPARERVDSLSAGFSAPTSCEPRKQRRHQGAREAASRSGASGSHAEQDRVCALLRARAAPSRAATAPRALLTIADAVISRYQRREGPARPARLRRPDRQDARRCCPTDRAAWVHYKLDLGIDHVLIDEAQDTSPKQWEIVRHLTAEFFAGAGARAACGARSSRSATRSSRSFRSRARRRASSTRCGSSSTSLARGVEHDLRHVQLPAFVPFRAERARRGRHGVRAAAGAARTVGRRGQAGARVAAATPRPAWSRSGR